MIRKWIYNYFFVLTEILHKDIPGGQLTNIFSSLWFIWHRLVVITSNITNTCYCKQLQMIPLLISNSFYELHWDQFSETYQNRWHDIARNNSFCNGYISVILCKYVNISRSYCSFCQGSLRNRNARWSGLPNKMEERQSSKQRMYRQLFGVLSKREESREIPYAHYFMWMM